jgi:class 3 adenylate cyclase/predicted ATPase/energy-coupling factor transporter ATP-binding protein EcfA2
MDVVAWLRGLGLERYAPAFRENDIDGEVLRELTPDDLISIGVTSVGHRRKLLAAIASLGTAPPAATVMAVPRDDSAPAGAERRQLTVMFCDLVGSTPLSVRFDPEDLREVIGAYHRCVADTVARFAGFVAKYMGDGVLIYFGYPEAHEDDAERAVRAGLAVIDAVGRLATPERLNVRLGVSSGLVVVGDLIGSGAAQERGVVGETPNLAARLQALAQPGSLLIAESTRRQIGALFEIEDLGPQPLAGFVESQRAWRIIGESGVLSRFEALRSEATPLVGRDEELELLLRRWQQAKTGEGRVVLVSGEPGIGKSRLTAALSQSIQSDQHTRLRYFCSPHHQDSALYPFITQLERAAAFAREDTPEAKLDKLEGLLAQSGESAAETAGLLADVLGLATDGRYPPLPADPQRKRELTLTAFVGQLEGLAAQRPVLLIFEDAQWADSTSVELLNRGVERAMRLSVLVLITFRPEFRAPWVGQAHVSSLSLSRLAERETAALVGTVASGKSLPAEVVDRIVQHSDGIPLFIEELTKTLLEGGLLREEEGGYFLAGPLPPLAIPSSLQGSLMARLDRLAPVKQVAQIGAALGREFPYELLAAVARRTDDQLRGALEQLVGAGLVFRRGISPRESFIFKHALVQEAAYGSLLRSQRQELHARIARVMEQRFPELAEEEPEILAHHCTQAGLADQAVSYLAQAGRRALDRSAMVEAASLINKALVLILELPESAERARRELDLQTALGRALTATKGYAAAETGMAYARARRLCENLGDTTALVRVGYGQYLYHLIRAETQECNQVASEILSFAEKTGSDEARILGHRTLGVSLFEFGRLAAAREQLELAANLIGHRQRQGMITRGDAGIVIPAWLAFVLAFQGHLDRAIGTRDLAVQEAHSSTSLHSRAFGLAFAAGTTCVLRQFEDLRLRADAICALASDLNFPFMLAWGLAFRGIANLYLDRADGEQAAREGLALYRLTGSKWALPFWLGSYASVQRRGSVNASTAVQEALVEVEATGERWYEAELYRLRGNTALCGRFRHDGRAEIDFRTAMRIAAEQGAKLLELRAATSMARLWGELGRRAEAVDLLASVYGWFTEGFDTADLKNAKALLDELA